MKLNNSQQMGKREWVMVSEEHLGSGVQIPAKTNCKVPP